MNRAPLTLAIVGCGDVAAYTAWFARLNRGLRLVACCDTAPGRAAAFAQRHRIPRAYTDIAELLDATPRPAALYLAVPHHLHLPLTQQAVAAGAAVLLEKPLALNAEEGRAVVAAADARGAKVGVNYQYRYDAGCYALAHATRTGALGEIRYARCHLPWRREPAYFTGAAWHGRLATAGGGTLITQGSHLLDVALWALGDRPVTAMGYTARRAFPAVEVEDLALGIVELASGALVEISSTLAAHAEQALSIEIYGSRGAARYTDKPWPRVQFRGVHPPKAPRLAGRLHALQRSLEGFRAWVVEDRPYLIPAREALPVLAAVDAIYRSSQTGRREEVIV